MFGIAPRQVSARDDYEKETVSLPSSKTTPSVIPGAPPLQDLVIPARSTIGARLLKSMGWKEGQGVGPKISKALEGTYILDFTPFLTDTLSLSHTFRTESLRVFFTRC